MDQNHYFPQLLFLFFIFKIKESFGKYVSFFFFFLGWWYACDLLALLIKLLNAFGCKALLSWLFIFLRGRICSVTIALITVSLPVNALVCALTDGLETFIREQGPYQWVVHPHFNFNQPTHTNWHTPYKTFKDLWMYAFVC